MGDKQYLIRLPWFPMQLMPNYKRRNHWTKYVGPTRKYRSDCWKATLAVTGASPSGLLCPLPMIICFNPPDNRNRDDDGVIGAFKAGRDGVADALGMDDNKFRPTYEFGEKVKGGCVLVHINPS